jgi:hypothetical protein
MDMRRLKFEKFLTEPSIFNRHWEVLMLRLKKSSNFHFVSNLNWGCSKWVQMLYLGPEIILLTFSAFFWLAVWFPAFSTIIALFGSWKLQELLNLGSEHKLRRILASTFVQDLNWAAPAIFRTQIEQIRTHFEQPQIRFRTKWKIWTHFEPQLKKLKCL